MPSSLEAHSRINEKDLLMLLSKALIALQIRALTEDIGHNQPIELIRIQLLEVEHAMNITIDNGCIPQYPVTGRIKSERRSNPSQWAPQQDLLHVCQRMQCNGGVATYDHTQIIRKIKQFGDARFQAETQGAKITPLIRSRTDRKQVLDLGMINSFVLDKTWAKFKTIVDACHRT